MFKMFIRFLSYTFVVFVAGAVVSGVGLAFSETPSALAFVGALIILLSPIAASFLIWKQRKRDASQISVPSKTRANQRKNTRRPRTRGRQKPADSVDLDKINRSRKSEKSASKNDDTSIVKANHPTGFDVENLPIDGLEFEKWVAEALIGFGWDAEVSGGSGDQGIDVIAIKDGITLGLQCKLYSSSIGNKAVQEAYAGKAYYNTDEVGVLSNAQYTASAKSLANVTGVHLFSHHDIPTLFEKMG